MSIQQKNYDPALMQGAASENTVPQTITAAGTQALAVGANGATNPVLNVNTNTASVATGINITGAATGTAVAIAAIGSATDEHLTINAKGAGTIKIGAISTGLITLGAPTLLKQSIMASSGNTTITAATSGSVRLFDSASTTAYTLPTPSVGLYYDFLWTALETGGQAHSITTDAGTTLLAGYITMFSDVDVTPSSTLGPKGFAGNGSSHVKVSMNGTTTGGGIGTLLRFTCISATVWNVSGVVRSPSGTIATPFST